MLNTFAVKTDKNLMLLECGLYRQYRSLKMVDDGYIDHAVQLGHLLRQLGERLNIALEKRQAGIGGVFLNRCDAGGSALVDQMGFFPGNEQIEEDRQYPPNEQTYEPTGLFNPAGLFFRHRNGFPRSSFQASTKSDSAYRSKRVVITGLPRGAVSPTDP